MSQGKIIKVLVVDDIPVFREIITKGIATDKHIQVISVANNPYDAVDKIIRYRPDVMICEIEMPRMNGLEFIKKLMPQYPMPVIVVSRISGAVFDAIKAGAVEFICKPNVNVVCDVARFINEMIEKIKIAAVSNVCKQVYGNENVHLHTRGRTSKTKLIAIGASTGGTDAIYRILNKLPADVPGIVIVQHIPPVFSRMFAERLNNTIGLNVKEACTGDVLERGKVIIAPGDMHMRLKKSGDKYVVECFQDEKVNGHCPAVDVLFHSVAKLTENNTVGIILTGMGYDGAKGLLAMKENGAKTIGQDESSSVVYGMPKVAYNIGAVDRQVPLDHVADTLCSIVFPNDYVERTSI